MTAEQPYVPTEVRVCIDFCNAAITRNGPGGEKLTMEQADQAFDRFIAKVKRDAAREALDSYIEYGVKHAQKWSTPPDAGYFRDTHYPEDVTP